MSITSEQAGAALSKIATHVKGMDKETMAVDVLMLFVLIEHMEKGTFDAQGKASLKAIAARYGVDWTDD